MKNDELYKFVIVFIESYNYIESFENTNLPYFPFCIYFKICDHHLLHESR